MACFVVGFLATAIPRFSGTHHASLGELITFLLLTSGITFFLFCHLWIPAELCFVSWLLALARFVFIRIKERSKSDGVPKNSPPIEFVWIPIAILHGILGSVILILYQSKFLPLWIGDVGEDMLFQGFILSIVAGVGGFLIPRLMGRFEMVKSSEVCATKEVERRKRRNLFVHATLGLLFFASFWIDIPGCQVWANSLRALAVTSALVWSRSLPFPPRTSDLFARLLWISAWMIPVGLWFVVAFPAQEKGMLHFTFIGGLSLMTFAIATMVVLSHAGESAQLRRPLPILWLVLIGAILALSFRVAAGFYPNRFFFYLGIAASLWIVVGTGWFCFVVPRIPRFPEEGTFEQEHEKMKRLATR